MPRPLSSYSFSDIRPGVDCPWDGLPELELTEEEIAEREEDYSLDLEEQFEKHYFW